MASFVKLVYLVIVLSIAADFISLGGYLFNTGDTTALQSSQLIPGANAVVPLVARVLVGAAVKALSKSAVKAAKKRAKERARKEGIARNKAKKARGKGTQWHFFT